MPISRKLVAAVITNLLTFFIALLVVKFGLHESTLVSTEISTVIGWLASFAAGWLAKEVPHYVSVPDPVGAGHTAAEEAATGE